MNEAASPGLDEKAIDEILIVTCEYVVKDERYMDDKGWFFGKAFEGLHENRDVFLQKKRQPFFHGEG